MFDAVAPDRAPSKMDDAAKKAYLARRKSSDTAYFLWILLASHRLYLGQLYGLLQPLLIVSGTVLLGEAQFGLGVGLLSCGGLWFIVDAFLIPGMVREYNTRLADSLTSDRLAEDEA